MAASSKFVTDAIKYCIYVCGDGKGLKYCQDQSRIMLLFEHTFRHNAVVLRVTLKSVVLKFSSIMYLTLVIRLVLFLEFLSFQVQFQPIPLVSLFNLEPDLSC